MNETLCLDDNTIAAFIGGLLPATDSDKVERHVERCDSCRAVLWEAVRIHVSSTTPTRSTQASLAAGPLPQGATLGPYVIVRCLGRGGMGTVYVAFDPRLERKIALKVMATAGDDRALLLREAQVMAKLSHPNVVAIHDVGIVEDWLYLAMELVEGTTLRQWMAGRARPWRELIPLFRDAARGLAAAHAAGIVHRDFKPENVLVGDDGRIRVTDFGLAWVTSTVAGSPRGGTPAYMAPEQRHGGPADPRGDQYSFCVALYEALHGQRPAPAPMMGARDDPAQRRRSPRVPRRIRRALERGLSSDPAARWPSMDAILQALSIESHPWRRIAALAVAGVLIAGAALIGSWQLDARRRSCRAVERHMATAWSGARRQAVEQALARTGDWYAQTVTQHVVASLERYVADWTAMHREICAPRIGAQPSDEVSALRLACLERRAAVLESATDRLLEVTPATVHRTVDLVTYVAGLRRCDADAAMESRVPPPETEAVRRAVEPVRRQLDRAASFAAMHRWAEALPLAEEAVAQARRIGYRPLIAKALHQLGFAQAESRDVDTSIKTLREAVWLAEASRDDETTATSWSALVSVLGVVKGDFEAALQAEERAQAALERLGVPPLSIARYNLLFNSGLVLATKGDHPAAQKRFEQALVIAEKLLPEAHPNRASVLEQLGRVAAVQGRFVEAADRHGRALAIQERAMGPMAAPVASILSNLAESLIMGGRAAEAEPYLRRAIAIYERSRSHRIGYPLFLLAEVETDAGRHGEALRHLERARGLIEPSLGPRHPAVAQLDVYIGAAQIALGRPQEALKRLEDSLHALEATYRAPHADTIQAMIQLGAARLALGEVTGSIRLLERGLAMAEARAEDEELINHARILLADALWRRGARDRAMVLARAARNACSTASSGSARRDCAQLERWLKTHRR